MIITLSRHLSFFLYADAQGAIVLYQSFYISRSPFQQNILSSNQIIEEVIWDDLRDFTYFYTCQDSVGQPMSFHAFKI